MQLITKKILHTLLSLLIVIATILALMRQAQANAAGVTVTAVEMGSSARGTAGMVEVTADVAGVLRTAALMPKPPVIAAAIIAGAGGAYVGDYLYNKYGQQLQDWAADNSGNIKVTLKTPVGSCTDGFGYGYAADTAEQLAAQVIARRWPGINYAVSVDKLGTVMVDTPNGSFGEIGKCEGAATTSTTVPAVDVANAAIAAAGTNANAADLVKKATADAVTPADINNAKPLNPTKPTDTPFDASGIIAAIQSLFNLTSQLLNAILTAVLGIPDIITAVIKDFWNWAIDSFQWIKDTANTWKDSTVKEYQTVKDAITKEYTDVRDWVYSTNDMPKDGDGNLDIPDNQNSNIDTDISFGGSCPANVVVPFGIGEYQTTITLMDFGGFCQMISTYLRPIVIAIASYQAVRILAGQKE